MCLKHALQLLDIIKHENRDLSGVELEINLSDAELKDLISNMDS